MANLSNSHDAVLSGHTADIYLSRTQVVLRAEGLDPVVTMEIFPAADGILCGVNEVLDLLAQVLPDDGEVWALSEGQTMTAKEIVLRITAPYSRFGLYETAMLGMLSQTSGWATAARTCVEAAEGIPIVSFGARHVHPSVAARLEYAAIVGGCAGCATPAGADLAGLEAIGTIPHAMILIFGNTVEATLAFDRHVPPDVRRVALVDTLKDEAEESLRVAEALGRKLWGVRLDTPPERGRVTPELVKELRARLHQAGHSWVKIVVSGGVDAARIRLFREQGAPVDMFGIGSAISSAPPIDFTGDLKVVAGRPIAKRGRIPGITANPRLKRVDVARVKEGVH
jgi:nicotinate phosphoribosyltransferase